MGIVLRKRGNKDGTTTLFLDIINNGQRKREFLKDIKLLKPVTSIDREENKQRLRLAEQIRNKREQELQSAEYDIIPEFKRNIDFISFFENYVVNYNKKDKRVMQACLAKFKDFMRENNIVSLTTKQVNEGIVVDFKEYLVSNLRGETPAGYFKRFKKVIKSGVQKQIFKNNPAQDVRAKSNEGGIKKHILSFDEIQLLATSVCGNAEVKRAFLYSCLTGLRYCDVVALKWSDINKNVMTVQQQKTGKPVTIVLNENALELIGEIKETDSEEQNKFVFKLPSHNACLKNLRLWSNKAGLNKKITWHCARHSFATNLIYYGSDLNSASSLLGHASLTYTQRYVRVVDELKQKAVDNLPKINL